MLQMKHSRLMEAISFMQPEFNYETATSTSSNGDENYMKASMCIIYIGKPMLLLLFF